MKKEDSGRICRKDINAVKEADTVKLNLAAEKKRVYELFARERLLSERGYRYIAGVDEAGRGPLAGPVVAAAVILPLDVFILKLNDSKLLSEKQREAVYEEIKQKAVAVNFSVVDEKYIDEHNILNATLHAMQKAVQGLSVKPDIVLVDALKIPGLDVQQENIIHGDRLCASIAAASIIAKVERDRIMKNYHELYPHYDFCNNKGYCTKKHVESIKKYGLSPIHRRSFSIKGWDCVES
ncbi:ribonuclease HII [Thermosediminibacter oceani]|uniref:Ribonuclease HII n=1 Tax=Thermosediminibacter oceani (strain ATCC BAA-1034 / DSM 16646 / JW/IW-1228P) TaxID=555079 RepID=D9S357_THEOJ|nr:ribonuclease HII [Thermosediminibacter oceani]ADL07834.1 RNase HII [Thermosediminibacter oceani DSM 16646]